MAFSSNPPIVARDRAAELLRQKLQRMRVWDCPLLTQDPGFGQMPPGLLWIRTDLQGCERYRLYDENGNVFTLCGDEQQVITTAEGDLTEVLFTYVASPNSSDDEISNTTTETFFATQYTIPADDADVNDVYRVRVRGVFQNTTGGATRVKFRQYLEASEDVETTDGLLLGNGLILLDGVTNQQWFFDVQIGFTDTTGTGSCHYYGRWGTRRNVGTPPDQEYGQYIGAGGSGTLYFAPNPADIRFSVEFDNADSGILAQLILMSVERMRIA